MVVVVLLVVLMWQVPSHLPHGFIDYILQPTTCNSLPHVQFNSAQKGMRTRAMYMASGRKKKIT